MHSNWAGVATSLLRTPSLLTTVFPIAICNGKQRGEDLIVSDQVDGSLSEETSTQSKPAFFCGLEKYAVLKKEQILITSWAT
jgi:hypothetical protein